MYGQPIALCITILTLWYGNFVNQSPWAIHPTYGNVRANKGAILWYHINQHHRWKSSWTMCLLNHNTTSQISHNHLHSPPYPVLNTLTKIFHNSQSTVLYVFHNLMPIKLRWVFFKGALIVQPTTKPPSPSHNLILSTPLLQSTFQIGFSWVFSHSLQSNWLPTCNAFCTTSFIVSRSNWLLISCLFWQYSDLYSSPYFMPSQEPAFGPVSDLRMPYWTHPHLPTIFAFPVSLWHYSRWHHLHNNYTVRYQHYHSPKASKHPSPLFNLDVQYPDFHLSVTTHDFLFRTDRFSQSLCLVPFPFPHHNFLMSIPPS